MQGLALRVRPPPSGGRMNRMVEEITAAIVFAGLLIGTILAGATAVRILWKIAMWAWS